MKLRHLITRYRSARFVINWGLYCPARFLWRRMVWLHNKFCAVWFRIEVWRAASLLRRVSNDTLAKDFIEYPPCRPLVAMMFAPHLDPRSCAFVMKAAGVMQQ